MSYLWVGIGGALGSMLRFWLATFVAAQFGEKFPLGTLIINITGSFAIGIFAAISGINGPVPIQSRAFVIQFLMVGICGGYTTFSAFSLQTLYLVQSGRWDLAGFNVLLSVALCFVAVWIGYSLATMATR